MSQDIKKKLESMNITEDQKKKLKSIFPEVFNENKIDWEQLQRTLGEDLDSNTEKYKMTWPGKNDCFKTIKKPSIGTLKPCREESVDFDNTENLFIEGDNLEVLKLLQKSYYNKIKMIYIDPPYNTGKDFVYPDNYSETLSTYLKYTGQKTEDGIKVSTNQETDGRFHSKWLNMMYPRLFLARNLLKDDGVIFISIDDNEVHNLRKICDEIFGPENFINIACVVRSKNGLGSKEGFAKNHDYFLTYKKTAIVNPFLYLRPDEGYLMKFNKKDEFGKYKMEGILRKKGEGQLRANSPGCFYPIYYNKKTGKAFLEDSELLTKITPKLPNGKDGRWIWSKDFAKQRLYRIHVSKNGTVYVKDYLQDSKRMKPKTVFQKTQYTTEYATKEIKNIFDEKIFNTPKPIELLVDLIDHTSSNSDITLDFFAGSATTAHAMMQLNAEDGGSRKCISVQLPEPTDEDSEAFKAGYKNIADIAKERIRRAGNKIIEDHKDTPEKIKNLDIGFKVLKLSKSNFKVWDNNPSPDIQGKLFDHLEEIISPNSSKEDVLFELLIKLGFEPTSKVEEKTMANKKVYSIASGSLLICLDDQLSKEVILEMAKLKPSRCVCLDMGFYNNDQLKTNAAETMRSHGVEFKTI